MFSGWVEENDVACSAYSPCHVTMVLLPLEGSSSCVKGSVFIGGGG